MASTSTSSVFSTTQYDVFLSFRGTDTRPNFTSHLYAALDRKSIKTFRDDILDRGDDISSSLLQTIRISRISVIVFSEDYANSRWCLEELAFIMECRENMGQIVLPIFYNVDPSDVRKQSGTFGAAFGEVKEKFSDNSDLLQKWSTALTKAGNLSRWTSSNYRHESDLTERVADRVKELCPITFTASLGLVGIDSHFEQIISLLRLDPATNVHSVGIWGMGGIGKTTLAECIFGEIAYKFDRFCFFRDVREKSEKFDEVHLLKSFYSQLLRDLETSDIQMVRVLPTSIKDQLSKMKVLVVLDDVNDPKQLEALLSEVPYGPGSRIIVTSRDKQVLNNGVDVIYKIEGLDNDNALQILSMKAFKERHPPKDYEELSDRAVRYAGGVPLALEVLGSDLHKKTPEEWVKFLEELTQFHDCKILKILRKSYDELDLMEKDIFLDIACFFKGDHIDRVKGLFDGCGLPSNRGISHLTDKCFITIGFSGSIMMHDLIQEMGQDIAQQEGSRRFKPKDILQMLSTNAGNEKVQGIYFDTSDYEEIYLHPAAFLNMHNLRILIVYQSRYCPKEIVFITNGGQSDNLEYLSNKLSLLDWKNNYPYKSLPSSLSVSNLVELNMQWSNITQLWNGGKL